MPATCGIPRRLSADIGKAQRLLGYAPTRTISAGIDVAMPWYVAQLGGSAGA